MKILYIHAGLPKTGTSYLQASLDYFEKNKLNKNFYYPRQEIKNYKIPSSGNAVNIFNLLKSKDDQKLKDEFKNIFSNNTNVFVSSEMLSNLVLEDILLLRGILKDLEIKPISIFFLRDLYDFYFSGYSQTIKRGGETRSFFENACDRQPLLDKPLIFKELGEVLVFKYEKNADNFQKLFNTIGLKTEAFKNFKIKKINKSLSHSQIKFFRMLNNIFPPTIISFFADRLSIYNKPQKYFRDQDVIKYLNNKYAKQIKAINYEFNINLSVEE